MPDSLPDYPLPILGFVAFSGTGKTTLLEKVIMQLKDNGLRIAVIKHSHHDVDIDKPGKDSYVLRKAGAVQTLIASRKRVAAIIELPHERQEPDLQDALAMIQVNLLDIILVEGFKHEKIPKIELHRKTLNKPYLYPHDKHIIALAEDNPEPGTVPEGITHLDINRLEQIVRFICGTVCGHL